MEDLRLKEQELSAELEAADQAFEDMRGSHGQLVDALKDVSIHRGWADVRNSPITKRRSSSCVRRMTKREKSSTNTVAKWIFSLSRLQITKLGIVRTPRHTEGSSRRESW